MNCSVISVERKRHAHDWSVVCTTTKMNAYFVPQFFICLQAVNTHRVRLLARILVPSQDFPFLASWGMVIKNIWRSKRCKVEHNTNSADKIFCVKEIAAIYIQTFSKLLVFCPSNGYTAVDFCARSCQCGGDFKHLIIEISWNVFLVFHDKIKLHTRVKNFSLFTRVFWRN